MVKSAYQPLVDFACDRRNVVVEWSADKLDLKLCENLTVRSIAPKSKAIFRFVIGDQIVDVNGKVPTSPGDVSALIKRFLPKVKITVNRVADRSPVSVDRMKQIGLKRIEGYCYFTVVLRKKSDSHLGMALKTFRGKCSVQRVEPNSVASNAYMAGDNILDINGERVSDFEKFKARFKHFMTTFKVCSTVVERPESPEALQATYAMLHLFAPTDSFPADAAAIAQREIARFLQNPEPSLKPIIVLPSKEDLKTCNENPFTTEGSIYKDENTGELKPVKNQAGKLLHITHAKKAQEILIDSDVQNPNLLQKTKSRFLKGSTMMSPAKPGNMIRGIPDSQSAPFTE